MKRIGLLLIVASLLALGACKKKEAQQPQNQDTTDYPGYEYMYSDESDGDTAVVDTTGQTSTTDTIDTTSNEQTAILKEDTTGKTTPANETEIKQANYIYLIVGSYKKYSNAEQRVNKFRKMGYDAQILPKYGQYNRVAAAKFTDEATARAKLKQMRAAFKDKSFWLLIRK